MPINIHMGAFSSWPRSGFGPDLIPYSQTLPFVIDYSDLPNISQSVPRDILSAYCWEIADRLPKPLSLMISGGVDSQAMSYAFKQAGVPVRFVMARYNDGLNDHDLFDTTFYADHGIEPEIMDLDVIGFHEDDLKDWAVKYQNHSPHILTQCKIASMIDGSVVSSGSVVTRQGIGTMNYSVFGLQRFSEISGKPMQPYFFNQLPELIGITRDLPARAPGIYLSKCEVYHKLGLPVQPQAQKQHGFEKLKAIYDEWPIDTRVRLKYTRHPSQRPYDLLFRYPLTDLVPYSEIGQMRF